MRVALVQAIAALNELQRAKDSYAEACKRAFPVGAWVSWSHGRHERIGEVIDHGGYGERLKVRSHVWERKYWIDANRVIRYAEEAAGHEGAA